MAGLAPALKEGQIEECRNETGRRRLVSVSASCLLPSGFKMVPEVGIAPTSPRLQRGANLPQLLGEMVVPAGNAPASSGYQPGALLLSYRTMAEGVGNAPTSARADPVFETGAASLYLPAFREMVRVARFALACPSFWTCDRVLYTRTKDPPREGTRPTGICRPGPLTRRKHF